MISDLPHYSVLMSVYSGEKAPALSESLQSMFSQSFPCEELILVCDGSLNPALDNVITEFKERYGKRFRVLRAKHHVGVGACANAGIRAARTDIIVKMDSDDIALPDRCEKQLWLLSERPDLDIVGGFIEEFDDRTGETIAVKNAPVGHEEILRYARRRNPFNNPVLVYRKRAALAVGGYTTVGRCEDYDLVARMLMNGSRGENIPEVLLRYRVSEGNLERRRDLRNTAGFIKVRWKLHRMGFSSLADFLIPCAAQLLLFALPQSLTGRFYKRFLRKTETPETNASAPKRTVRKSALKQRFKTLLQKTLLPLCYRSAADKPIDPKLILFADSNGTELPDSMRPLWEELTRRGYTCEKHCFRAAAGVSGITAMCRFMRRYARAAGVVVCNYFLPVSACEKRPETRVVQLWHSCGALKKFGYSTPNDISPDFKGSVAGNIDLVTVSSPACVPAFEEAFGLKKGVARPTGVSRTDIFFDENAAHLRREELYKAYPELRGKKILLYLPTFRGDASKAYTVGQGAVAGLRDTLGGDWEVVIRTHPRVREGITDLPEIPDTETLMLCADMLVTDYSSAVFEYALLDRPMLLWCPDLEEYLDERDFYLDFKRDMPCGIVTDERELPAAVKRAYEGFTRGSYKAFTEKYMSACDGRSTARAADFITGKDMTK